MSYTKVTASFTEKYGLRPVKSLLTRLNQGIVLRNADDLQFSRGSGVGAQNYLGKCLDLVEANQNYVQVADDTSLNKSTYDTALECWVKVDSSTTTSKLIFRSSGNAGEKLEINLNGKVLFTIGDGPDTYLVVGATDIRDDRWHHIFAYVDKSSEAYIFVDGVDDSDTRSGTLADVGSLDVSDNLYIGKESTSYTTAQIEEVRSWKWTSGIPSDIDTAILENYKCPYEISPRLSSSDLVMHLKFNDSALSASFTDETANNNDGTPYQNGGAVLCTDLQADSSLKQSLEYENETPHAGTRAFRIKTFWDADDDNEYCLYYWYYNASNYIQLYKNTLNELVFKIVADGDEKTATVDIAAIFDAGEWFSVVVVWNLSTKFDETNYIKMYVNSSNTDTNSNLPGEFEDVGSDYRIGYDGSYLIDAIVAFLIDSVTWYDTIANAEAAEFPQGKSVEHWHNSGSFNLPIIDGHVKACLLDELSSNDKPEIGFSVTRILLAEDSETTDSSTHKKVKITADADDFYVGERILVGVPITYSNKGSWSDWCEAKKIDTITDNGDGTITITFDSALDASKRTNYTTANEAFVTNNLCFDGNLEEYGIVAWVETSVESLKDGSDVFSGRQSVRTKATSPVGTLNSQNIGVEAGENYLVSVVHKVDSGNGVFIMVYDVTNSTAIKTSGLFENTAYNLYEMSFEVPAGCTEIKIAVIVRDSGESCNLGNVLLLKNMMDNGGFEGTYVSSLAPGWTKNGTPTLLESADEHGGDKAQSINGDSSNYIYQQITVVSGEWYTVSGYVKGTNSVIKLFGATTKTLTSTYDTDYRKVSYTFKALSGTLTVQLYGNGAACLFDDFSLIKLHKVEASTSTPSPAASCYKPDKWGNSSRAFCLSGATILKYLATNVLNPGLGTIVCLIKAPFNYDDFDSRDFYLFEIDEVFRIWYDASAQKFKFDVYNGASWLSVESVAQTFDAGDWIYVFGLFNNQSGLTIYVNTTQGTTYTSTWDEQSITGKYIYLMSDHDGEQQADCDFDYPHGYDEYLTAAQIEAVVNGNWGDK